jgi:NAD(P)-dependent dehydrogenase (short-subunit alcohol dehydrogenase family)
LLLHNFSRCLLDAIKRLCRPLHRRNVVYARIAQINSGALLRDRRVLITGGGSGIGFAIAQKCLSEGAEVVITGRSRANLAAAADRLQSPRLRWLVWDISDFAALESRLLQATALISAAHFDILVNNAGILESQDFRTTSEETWNRTFDTNLKGPFFLTQAICREWLSHQRSGKILNICSTAGFLGAPYPYRMAKWSLLGFTRGLAAEMAPHGIIVNGVAPGRTATNMLGRDSGADLFDTHQPLQRLGTPEEIAELAVFLLSDAANYIVGQTIICDGGYTLQQ